MEITTIVFEGAREAGALAEKYTQEHQLDLTVFYPNWDKCGKRVEYVRNQPILDSVGVLIAFWNGMSRGTQMQSVE